MRTDTEVKEVTYNYCLTIVGLEGTTMAYTNDVISLERKLDKKLMQWVIDECTKKNMVILNIFYLGEEDG